MFGQNFLNNFEEEVKVQVAHLKNEEDNNLGRKSGIIIKYPAFQGSNYDNNFA